jgi:hypothetical protein
MLFEEFLDNLLTKNIGNSSLIIAPLLRDLVEYVRTHARGWIRPQDVAEDSEVRNLRGPLQPANLVERLQLGGQTAVHGQNLVVNERANREVVK